MKYLIFYFRVFCQKFINNKTKESLDVIVVDLLKYSDFNSLLNDYDAYSFGSNNKDLLLEDIRTHYSIEDEKNYGVLGIKIALK